MNIWTNQMTYAELRLLKDRISLSLHKINYVLETSLLSPNSAEILQDTKAMLDKMIAQLDKAMKG